MNIFTITVLTFLFMIEYPFFERENAAAEASDRNVLKSFRINFHAAVDKVDV